jgi:SAM-dependent methyltransferase
MNQDCLACLSQNTQQITLRSGHQARQCNECGLVWAIDAKGSKQLYESAYNDQQQGFTWNEFLKTPQTLKKGGQVKLHWYEEDFLNKYTPFGDRRLMEVGCSTGRFLHVCQRAGWTIHGTDISEKAVAMAKDLLPDADLRCGTLEQVNWPENYFEFFTAWEVIEHVDNPFGFISHAAKLLCDNGMLALSTPDWGSWAIKRHPKINYWPPYHVWFFNEKSVSALLRRCGLKIIRVKRNRIPWSETCWPKTKRYMSLPFLIWKGIILRQGGGRLVVYAGKTSKTIA